MNRQATILLIGSFIFSFSFADVTEDKLETNINDRMKNAASIDQKKPAGISDSTITREIEKNLKSEKLSAYGKAVKVISANGHVTLKGRILSKEEENLIIQKVRSVGGVTMVLNEMQIIPEKK